MTLQPYTDGILPGGSAAPIGFTKSGMPWTNSFPINFGGSSPTPGVPGEGSLLQPVTDWSSFANSAPVASTGSPSHSCQNGGSCSCGGKCRESQASEVPQSRDPLNSSDQLLKEADVEELDQRFGSTFIAGDPSTNGAIVTVNTDSEAMIIRIRSIADGAVLFEATLPRNGADWGNQERMVRGGLPKISYGIAAFINLMAQHAIASKLGQTLSFDVGSGKLNSEPSASATRNGFSPLQTAPKMSPCIKYDLVCTMPFIEADGKHLSLWMLPIGNFQVDIGNCCLKHDIAWWCATGDLEIDSANAEVIGCIASQILNAALGACNSKFSCHGLFYDLCKILVAACDALAAPFVAAYEAAVDIGGWVGTSLVAWRQDDSLFNFNGDHSNSCLCGGTEITYQCPGYIDDVAGNPVFGNPCRNVCLDVGSIVGAEPGCFDCYWQCQYDADGNLLPTSPLITDPNNPCCTGSAGTTSPLDGSPCDPLTKSCAATNCNQCSWKCEEYGHTGQWKWLTTGKGDKPCCAGTPGPAPKSACEAPCANCYWKRIKIGHDHEWVTINPYGKKRECCQGTPGKRP